MSSLQREVEHTTDEEASSENLLANLTDQQQDHIQMQKMFEMTTDEGYMKLPVKQVVSAENSPQWAIEIEHPVTGVFRIYKSKPVHGWTDDEGIGEMLKWYGITNQNPHALQVKRVYVDHRPKESDQAHGWVTVEPPEYDAPVPVQLRRKADRLKDALNTGFFRGSFISAYFFVGLVMALSPLLTAFFSSAVAKSAAAAALFVISTAFVMAILKPPEN